MNFKKGFVVVLAGTMLLASRPTCCEDEVRDKESTGWARLSKGVGFFVGGLVSHLICVKSAMKAAKMDKKNDSYQNVVLCSIFTGILGMGLDMIGGFLGCDGFNTILDARAEKRMKMTVTFNDNRGRGQQGDRIPQNQRRL